MRPNVSRYTQSFFAPVDPQYIQEPPAVGQGNNSVSARVLPFLKPKFSGVSAGPCNCTDRCIIATTTGDIAVRTVTNGLMEQLISVTVCRHSPRPALTYASLQFVTSQNKLKAQYRQCSAVQSSRVHSHVVLPPGG